MFEPSIFGSLTSLSMQLIDSGEVVNDSRFNNPSWPSDCESVLAVPLVRFTFVYRSHSALLIRIAHCRCLPQPPHLICGRMRSTRRMLVSWCA